MARDRGNIFDLASFLSRLRLGDQQLPAGIERSVPVMGVMGENAGSPWSYAEDEPGGALDNSDVFGFAPMSDSNMGTISEIQDALAGTSLAPDDQQEMEMNLQNGDFDPMKSLRDKMLQAPSDDAMPLPGMAADGRSPASQGAGYEPSIFGRASGLTRRAIQRNDPQSFPVPIDMNMLPPEDQQAQPVPGPKNPWMFVK